MTGDEVLEPQSQRLPLLSGPLMHDVDETAGILLHPVLDEAAANALAGLVEHAPPRPEHAIGAEGLKQGIRAGATAPMLVRGPARRRRQLVEQKVPDRLHRGPL